MKKLIARLQGFYKYNSLTRELVKRDIKVRYRKSFLGVVWTILNPILMMIVMTIVFSHLFRFEIENFTVYFLCGNILWAFMNESTNNALNSILANQSLIKKVYIPKYLFPFSKVMSSLVNLGFSFIALIIVMIVTGTPFYWTMLLSPVPVLYLVVFSFGLGMILSTAMVFFRDIAQLYSVITLAWMYMTPLFYPVSMLQDAGLDWVLVINPMQHYISYFRSLVLYNTIPGVTENLTCIGISVVVLIIGIVFFYKKQDKFILYI